MARKEKMKTTVTIVIEDNENVIAVVGTVKDLVKVGLIADCTDNCDFWAAIPAEVKEGGASMCFAPTKEEVVDALVDGTIFEEDGCDEI